MCFFQKKKKKKMLSTEIYNRGKKAIKEKRNSHSGKGKVGCFINTQLHNQASSIIMCCHPLCFQPCSGLLCALFYLALKFYRLSLTLKLSLPKLRSLEWPQAVSQNVLNHKIMKLCRRPKQMTGSIKAGGAAWVM